ncbi:putative reverse transcriptase domain-containing protein [Tanacetum coccineum]
MCCDDAYLVTPRVSALAGCNILVSEPGYREVEEEPIEEEPLEEPKQEGRPGPAESGDSCKSKVKPKRGPTYLCLIIEMCSFGKANFLRHVVNSNGIHVDPSKIEAMENWKAPKTPSEILPALRKSCWLLRMRQSRKRTRQQKCCVAWISKWKRGKMEVIVDRLTKSAYFLTIREDYKSEKLSRLYINEIVVRHGVPMSIISDCDGRFTSQFYQTFKKALGTRLDMSMAYHPQMDGPIEPTNQTLKDMLRACVIDFGGSWDTHLPLAEFSYNNSYHSSVRCAPFKALYGKKCRLKAARDCQNSYVGNRRKQLGFKVGDKVMLEVLSWKGVKFLADANLHVPIEEIKVDKTLHFVKESVEIIDREIKSLKHSRILIVKVH